MVIHTVASASRVQELVDSTFHEERIYGKQDEIADMLEMEYIKHIEQTPLEEITLEEFEEAYF